MMMDISKIKISKYSKKGKEERKKMAKKKYKRNMSMNMKIMKMHVQIYEIAKTNKNEKRRVISSKDNKEA